jgi:hypothetical protein
MNEKFLMHYDATTGDILGFYLKSIHGDNIPTPIIEITSEKHQFYMKNNGKYRLNPSTLEDQQIPVVEVTTEPTLEERLTSAESALSALLGV